MSLTFRRLGHSVGLEQVRLHDLRHFVATTLLGAGVDLQTVAGRLGHAGGGRTTLAVYSHFQQATDRDAADLLGKLLVLAVDGTRQSNLVIPHAGLVASGGGTAHLQGLRAGPDGAAG